MNVATNDFEEHNDEENYMVSQDVRSSGRKVKNTYQ